MSREKSVDGIILKKNPFAEADEIVTIYTKEQGKLRVLAKSSKLSGSKLSHGLQPFLNVNARIAGNGNLPKIIGVKIINSFPQLRENVDLIKQGFVAAEIVNKATPDEQSNLALYNLLLDFYSYLDREKEFNSTALLSFKTKVLEVLGLGVHVPTEQAVSYNFNSSSGFVAKVDSTGFYQVDLIEDFKKIMGSDFNLNFQASKNLSILEKLVSDFMTFQLEREIKSERFL